MKKKTGEIIIRGREMPANEGIRVWYENQLKSLTESMMREVTTAILTIYGKNSQEIRRLYAQDASPVSEQQKKLSQLEKEYRELFIGKAKSLAESMVKKEQDFALFSVKNSLQPIISSDKGAEWVSIKGSLFSSAEEEIMKAAIDYNITLIKSLEERFFNHISQLVFNSILNAYGITALKEGILKIKGSTRRNASLIAEDQNKKVFEAISRVKLSRAGIKEYEWVYTYGAKKKEWERVYHRDALNKGVYPLERPIVVDPKTKEKGFPGTLIRCHCVKRPVIRIGARIYGKESRPQ